MDELHERIDFAGAGLEAVDESEPERCRVWCLSAAWPRMAIWRSEEEVVDTAGRLRSQNGVPRSSSSSSSSSPSGIVETKGISGRSTSSDTEADADEMDSRESKGSLLDDDDEAVCGLIENIGFGEKERTTVE